MHTATWITIALLAPFWWGLGLLLLALLGDLSPRWRRRVSRLFDRLEGTRGEPPVPERLAAWTPAPAEPAILS